MIRQLQLLFIGILFIQVLHAQQLPIFTQYRESLAYINPAAVSSDYFVNDYQASIGLSHRSQWIGFEAGPKTQLLKGSYILDNGNAVSLITGGMVLNDQTDPFGMTGIYGRIGGILSDDPSNGGFSLGITAGMVQYRLNTNDLAIRDLDDVAAQNYAVWRPDVGIGVYYYNKLNKADFIYTGLSVPQVLGIDLMYENNIREFAIKRIQHVYGLLGYYKQLSDNSFLEASTWAKYAPNAPFNLDINVRYQFSHAFWVGTGGSTAGSVQLEAGVLLDWHVGLEHTGIRIGYAYNHYFTSYGALNHFGDAHELNLTYSFLNN